MQPAATASLDALHRCAACCRLPTSLVINLPLSLFCFVPAGQAEEDHQEGRCLRRGKCVQLPCQRQAPPLHFGWCCCAWLMQQGAAASSARQLGPRLAIAHPLRLACLHLGSCTASRRSCACAVCPPHPRCSAAAASPPPPPPHPTPPHPTPPGWLMSASPAPSPVQPCEAEYKPKKDKKEWHYYGEVCQCEWPRIDGVNGSTGVCLAHVRHAIEPCLATQMLPP